MPLKLYKMDLSPPACAALMICDIHNIPVQIIDVNLLAKDNWNPEYLKKNPVHTVPMLEDDDLILHDSHAILTYLPDKYGKDQSLYPKDLKQRAQIDQKLFLDTLLFSRVKSITYPAFFENAKQPTQKQLNDLDEAYGFLEAFLSNTKYIAGDSMTIADISIVSTASVMRYIVPINATKYPNVQAWFSNMEEQGFYQKCLLKRSADLGKLLEKHLDL